ncbi:VOC family protein [Salinicoccus roseus]|uniref:VOC family protein n=1 Tax=Salinicoccus roseus TaxID=45670 RepID=UPI000F50F51E|nr:VOC family protein [Salinicoccus roseus]RPE54218.1 putative 3-demethylubiquinone-9 3-methyltransferase (glyoxalase superfamily) [Salinicoccus roseus]GGA67284.1 VOC family protein [Salinicoccus roseus]
MENQLIVPHLWFDTEAEDAVEFYMSIFPESKLTDRTTLHDTPSGDAQQLSFELYGYKFMVINAGPYFTFNPSISFFINFDPLKDEEAERNLEKTWNALIDGGTALMPLDEYPFSKKYGWVEDKFGVSWQLILGGPETGDWPNIVPSLMFIDQNLRKCEDALEFYLSVFENSRMGEIARFPEDTPPHLPGSVMYSDFMIEGQWFSAMDSAGPHEFNFNEAISLMVLCEDQKAVDYYWNALSAEPEAEQCGWLKDKFGVSWQIIPKEMNKMISNGSPEQLRKVTQAFLEMKKIDLEALKQAYES